MALVPVVCAVLAFIAASASTSTSEAGASGSGERAAADEDGSRTVAQEEPFHQPPRFEGRPQRPQPEFDDPAELGRFLYQRDCLFCHGAEGEGTFNGPALDGFGAAGIHYVLVTGRMPITRADERVRRGDPPYTDAEIDALVAYTADFIDGPTIPEVDLGGADLARGGQLYRKFCAACHGATGLGGGLAFGDLAPHLFEASPTVVAETILVGPGAMPSFAAELPGDEMIDVVAYVMELQQPATPGGIPLRGARVAEGLVAMVAGIVLLGAAAMWIGERR